MRIRSWLSSLFALGLLMSCLPRASAIVGFANVQVSPGFNLIANPLDNSANTLNPILSNGVPDGAMVFLWNSTNQSFSDPSTFSAGFGWDLNYDISPGKGFMLWSPSIWTNTFVGTVLTGTLTNFVVGTNRLSLLGDKVPVAGQLATNHLFPLIDSAAVYTFNTGSQSYRDAVSSFVGYGWFDPKGLVDTNGPSVNVGQGFFAQNPGPGTNWTKTFTPDAFSGAGPPISSFTISGDKIVLKISNAGAPYDIQFSTDRIVWQTIASGQTSEVWTGLYPHGKQGYYQAVKP